MCHFLYIASSLTLSEIRSMLPQGLAADLLDPAEAGRLLPLLPGARTGARLIAGACSCDLFLTRDLAASREEAELRARYRTLGLSREAVMRALQRHRRRGSVALTSGEWAGVLAGFVAEHARNGGSTLYYREFSPARFDAGPAEAAVEVPLHKVQSAPEAWLPEGRPVVVARGDAPYKR